MLPQHRVVEIHRPDGKVILWPQYRCDKPMDGVYGWHDLDNRSDAANDLNRCKRKFVNFYKQARAMQFSYDTVFDELKVEWRKVYHHRFEDTLATWQCQRGIWLGGGKSTGRMAQHTAQWFDENYDIAVCANYGWEAFEQIALECKHTRWVWMMVERDAGAIWSDHARWQERMPDCFTRVVLARGFLSDVLTAAGCENDFKGEPHYVMVFKDYTPDFQPRIYHDALQCGEHEEGTVTLQALHLLAVVGSETIDAYGCELDYADDEPVHFYEAKRKEPPDWQLGSWAKSAAYIRSLLPAFEQAGVTINFKCPTRILQ